MKTLLILVGCFISFHSLAQDQPDLKKLGRPFKLERKQALPKDTIVLPNYKTVIPNAITGVAGKAQLIGNNGKGQNIYVLPLDKMPCIRPDSTYKSNMPVAGGFYKLP
jgi:hypothetical protein